jgi:hypothetical protein
MLPTRARGSVAQAAFGPSRLDQGNRTHSLSEIVNWLPA